MSRNPTGPGNRAGPACVSSGDGETSRHPNLKDLPLRSRSSRLLAPAVLLDADEGRAVLGASSPTRTLWWHAGNDGTARISGRDGHFADIRADRVATIKGTGEDACSILATLPPKAVVGVSPDGPRLLTQHVYADGPVHGTKKSAIVRCELGDCERASRRIDAP